MEFNRIYQSNMVYIPSVRDLQCYQTTDLSINFNVCFYTVLANPNDANKTHVNNP